MKRLILAMSILTVGMDSEAISAQMPPPVPVGVVYWSMNIQGQVAMRRGLEREAEAINRRGGSPRIRLLPEVGGDGLNGVGRQVEAMSRLIAAKPGAIILQPIDSAALSRPVTEANRQGIPVVAYDQYTLNGRLACYLTSNNYLAGQLDGEYLAHRFRHRTAARPLRLIVVEYPYVSSTIERVEGLRDALVHADVPYRIVARYEAVEPVAGAAVGRRIVAEHPRGTVDAVFCVNDGGGVAVMKELERARRTDLVMATIDGDPEAVAAIRRGGLIGIDTAQFCGPLGAESLRWTHALLQGRKVPRQVLVTVYPITKESLGAYPGWMGPIPAVIRRPWPPHLPVPGNQVRW